MPIVYALVARQKIVLAEFTNSSGNFPTVTRVLLSKISQDDGKMSYVYDKHVFHFIVDNGITFLCMTDEDVKRRVTFGFLEDIKRIWRSKYASIEGAAMAFSLQETFSPILKQQIDLYSANTSGDNISRVQAQIDTVIDVMVDNIDKVLERGEKIELLVDKTEKMNQQATKFERQSKSLKYSMWWSKIRNYLVILFILALVIFFISAMICGLDFKKCMSK